MTKKIQTINGILKYNDDGQYEIHNSNRCFNLSQLLDKIYYSDTSNYINLCIMDGCKVLFNEDGNLYKNKDSDGIYSYFILGNNLEKTLFDNTDKKLEFTLYAETIGEKGYGQFFTRTTK